MHARHYPFVAVIARLLLFTSAALCMVGFAGCATGNGNPLDGPAHLSVGKVAVSVEASSATALITANGSLKGATPVSIEVEVDELGDVAVDVDLTASFADSMGLKNPPPDPVSYRINRGERPPTVVRFDTDGAVAH